MQTTRTTQVFIVEDSAPIRARLTDMLARIEGVSVVGEAASASKAVVDILAMRPDSVLLDLNLNGTSGLQVMRAVHPKAPGIVFIVLTNHTEPQYRNACARAGASYFLDKSSEFDRVPHVIAEIASTPH